MTTTAQALENKRQVLTGLSRPVAKRVAFRDLFTSWPQFTDVDLSGETLSWDPERPRFRLEAAFDTAPLVAKAADALHQLPGTGVLSPGEVLRPGQRFRRVFFRIHPEDMVDHPFADVARYYRALPAGEPKAAWAGWATIKDFSGEEFGNLVAGELVRSGAELPRGALVVPAFGGADAAGTDRLTDQATMATANESRSLVPLRYLLTRYEAARYRRVLLRVSAELRNVAAASFDGVHQCMELSHRDRVYGLGSELHDENGYGSPPVTATLNLGDPATLWADGIAPVWFHPNTTTEWAVTAAYILDQGEPDDGEVESAECWRGAPCTAASVQVLCVLPVGKRNRVVRVVAGPNVVGPGCKIGAWPYWPVKANLLDTWDGVAAADLSDTNPTALAAQAVDHAVAVYGRPVAPTPFVMLPYFLARVVAS